MISHSHKWIWVAINKTATTSMAKKLTKKCFVSHTKHQTLLEAKTAVTPIQYKKYFKFTVVRNPWDRILSLYLYRELKDYTGVKKDKINFEKWLELCFVDKNKRYCAFNGIKFTQSQVEWISDGTEINVNFIGKFENLEKAWKIICNEIGIDHSKLPKIKTTKHRHYRHYYNARTKKIIKDFFERDIDLFKYNF